MLNTNEQVVEHRVSSEKKEKDGIVRQGETVRPSIQQPPRRGFSVRWSNISGSPPDKPDSFLEPSLAQFRAGHSN